MSTAPYVAPWCTVAAEEPGRPEFQALHTQCAGHTTAVTPSSWPACACPCRNPRDTDSLE